MLYVDMIIFDLDGTLVDTGEDIIKSVNETLSDMGLPERGDDEIISHIGFGFHNLLRRSIGVENEYILEETIKVYKTKAASREFMNNSEVYPNVIDTLECFQDKKKVIISNRNVESVIEILKNFNIYEYFDSVRGGDDPDCIKPSSCPLDKAIFECNIMDRNKAIMVGDMAVDILAGKNACVYTCGVTYGIGNKQDVISAAPDFLIDRFSQLTDIIC